MNPCPVVRFYEVFLPLLHFQYCRWVLCDSRLQNVQVDWMEEKYCHHCNGTAWYECWSLTSSGFMFTIFFISICLCGANIRPSHSIYHSLAIWCYGSGSPHHWFSLAVTWHSRSLQLNHLWGECSRLQYSRSTTFRDVTTGSSWYTQRIWLSCWWGSPVWSRFHRNFLHHVVRVVASILLRVWLLSSSSLSWSSHVPKSLSLFAISSYARGTVTLINFQDYHWWWRSYLTFGSLLSTYFLVILYFFTKLQIVQFVPTLLFFGYMFWCPSVFLSYWNHWLRRMLSLLCTKFTLQSNVD